MLITTKSPIAEVTAADHQVDLMAVTSNPISIGDVGGSLTSAQKLMILNRLNMGGLISLDDIPPQASFMIEKIEAMTTIEALDILAKSMPDLSEDPNFAHFDYDLLERLVSHQDSTREKLKGTFEKEKEASVTVESISDESLIDSSLGERQYLKITDWDLQVRLEASLIEYWSPYEQVRAICDPYDDTDTICETPRVYIVGIIWCAIGAVIGQFFAERYPHITLGSSVVQVFIYPSGVLMSYILPKWKFNVWKYTIDLNPGPWTHKEQMLTTLMYSIAATSSGGTYVSTYNILTQQSQQYYGSEWATWGFQILLSLSTQFMGFGFAGVIRRFAVYPSRTVWPTYLPTLALNKALVTPEKRQNINGWTISRFSFFFITSGISFLYFWVPNYLFKALSTFSWMTWIKPDNFNLATITGSQTGLGLNPIPSFDWNIIGTGGFSVPFYNTINGYVGSVIGFFIIVGMYYSNFLWTAYIPINSNSLFTNKGTRYNVRSILTKDNLFDEAKYQKYGPPYYSAANLLNYGATFALFPFAFLYEVLTNYKVMWVSLKSLIKGLRNIHRSSYEDFDDPHCRMMSKYKEVPEWAYTIIMVASLVLGILAIKLYPTQTPVWGIFFAIGMNFVFIIPMISLASVTGFTYGLNVLIELIVGYAVPGNPQALNIIKAYGYIIDAQSENYITNQKYAHYMKIPPRSMFRVQILAVLIYAFICLAILNFQMVNIKDLCTPHQAQKLTCPGANTFFSASIIWGVIGPKKIFNGVYPILKYCFLIGFLLAILCAAIKRWAPKKISRNFHPTIILGGMMIYAPYNLSFYTGGVYICYASMVYLKNRYPAWWEKYNYILACGIGSGIAFSAIIIFFAVQYHPKKISWWGNNVNSFGYDYLGTSMKNATVEAPEGYFGLRYGHFP